MFKDPIEQKISYFKIMLGKGSIYAKECLENGYVGVGWFADTSFLNQDMTEYRKLRDFNDRWVPEYLKQNPTKSKVTAGLACGSAYTVCFDMNIGDFVIAPKGDGSYAIGTVSGNYEFVKGASLPHQRKVQWFSKSISKDEISQQLKNSNHRLPIERKAEA